MSVFIHDYILETTKDEQEVEFEPSGQSTVAGIPVGKITFIYRRIVTGKAVKKYVSAYSPSTGVVFPGGGSENGGGYGPHGRRNREDPRQRRNPKRRPHRRVTWQ